LKPAELKDGPIPIPGRNQESKNASARLEDSEGIFSQKQDHRETSRKPRSISGAEVAQRRWKFFQAKFRSSALQRQAVSILDLE